MTLFVLFVIALAAVVALFLHRGLRQADRKRRQREWRRRHPSFSTVDLAPLIVRINADIRDFAEAVQKAAATIDRMWVIPEPVRVGTFRRCRCCRLLGRIGLSHHAAHYQPRHRAATR